MERGKHICETLKGIRREIAKANGIDYEPSVCDHEGDCPGTCPLCESETRWLEEQLRLRQQQGKTIDVAGAAVILDSFTTEENGKAHELMGCPASDFDLLEDESYHNYF